MDLTWFSEQRVYAPREMTLWWCTQGTSEKILGVLREYKSVDTLINADEVVTYPAEFLNSSGT